MERQFVVRIVLTCIVALIPFVGWGQSNNTTARTKLKIALPVWEFSEFVSIKRNPVSGVEEYSGFAVEVFTEVMKTALPSPIDFEFVPFRKPDGTMNGTFDDMLKAVFSKDYDGAVGEISILFYRTPWVDFTMPYMESTIGMLVPITKQPTRKDDGYSLKGITFAFLITAFCLGFIAFPGAAINGCIIFARYSKQKDNPQRDRTTESTIQTRLLIIIFFLILLTPNACYIVSQTSSNALQRRSATVKNLNQLFKSESNVGYIEGSFIYDLLLLKGFPESKLISLKSERDMVEMLSKGTSKGGVDAIVANAPQLKLLQAKYCDNFTMVSTNLRDSGFGFAFGKGQSTLVDDVSTGLIKLAENGKLGKIQERTIGSWETCQENPSNNIDVAATLFLSSRDYPWILIIGGILLALLILISFIFHVYTILVAVGGEY